MKMTKTFILASAFIAVTNVQAAAVSNMSIAIDWGTLAITGPLGSLTSFTDPMTGDTFSSDAEGWVGSGNTIIDSAYAVGGASAIANYSDTAVIMSGGYDSITNMGGGDVVVTNSGTGGQSGWAGAWRGFIYQASGNGAVTVSVDYSLLGSISTTSSGEYANGGYELLMDAVDADLWISTYNSAISSGSDNDTAENVAELAATLGVSSSTDWQLLECFGTTPCTGSVDQGDILSVNFNVVAGKNYFFGADVGVSSYTDVSAVPVPGAVWLFGSGLIGMIGMAKRKKSV